MIRQYQKVVPVLAVPADHFFRSRVAVAVEGVSVEVALEPAVGRCRCHALHSSGDGVAFGSTTGNLYVSDNRGDSWRSVANNLPPIYSVRFA